MHCDHVMHCRQHNNEVYLKWYQDDDWNSKSLTKMSQGVSEGNEQDKLNLEYFRYATVSLKISYGLLSIFTFTLDAS